MKLFVLPYLFIRKLFLRAFKLAPEWPDRRCGQTLRRAGFPEILLLKRTNLSSSTVSIKRVLTLIHNWQISPWAVSI